MNSTKRRFLGLCAILIAAFSPCLPAAADEIVDIYKELYLGADSLSQQHYLMERMIEVGDPESAPFITEALASLIARQESVKLGSEKQIYFGLVKLIATALGEYGYLPAAPHLWELVTTASDPLVRAEGLFSLGKIKAVDYTDKIALLLRDLNFKPTIDTDAGEKTAFGAIVALGALKQPNGWEPVFAASDSWYSSQTRQMAETTLPEIIEDPTDIIRRLIPGESIPRKTLALKQGLASKAPDSRKISLAVFALTEGLRQRGKDKKEEAALGDLRRKAISGLIGLGSKDPQGVPQLQLSYELGEVDEKLLALQALGIDGGNAAVEALRKIILDLDKMTRDGRADENKDRLARAAIENAGRTRNSLAKPALVAVASNSKWSGSVINAANTALKLLK